VTSTGTGTSTSTSTGSTGDGDGDPETSSTSTSTPTETETETETGLSFVPPVEFGNESCMCDPIAQDCPEGEKCVPQSIDDGGVWDCVLCLPISGDLPPGSPCSLDNPLQPVDDCGATSFCWNAHESDGQWVGGVCRAFCGGTYDNPICPPAEFCLLTDQGNVTLCVPSCDPLLQDCADTDACGFDRTGFACTHSHGSPVGAECETRHDCAPGLQCVDAAELPACAGLACCTSFCALDIVDPQCDALPGSECVAMFEPDSAPPGADNVGLCVLP
jgi:hypothetical protein